MHEGVRTMAKSLLLDGFDNARRKIDLAKVGEHAAQRFLHLTCLPEIGPSDVRKLTPWECVVAVS